MQNFTQPVVHTELNIFLLLGLVVLLQHDVVYEVIELVILEGPSSVAHNLPDGLQAGRLHPKYH